jgi:hypothetical protein
VGWLDRVRSWGSALGSTWDGTTGAPRSANSASSFHLSWQVDGQAAPRPWVEVSAVLEIVEAPRVPALVFWALQASFVDRGRAGGAGHLGLQWYPAHPGSTAVNWGGYDAGGAELRGSASAQPSATGNVNTRDLAWSPGVAYRLRIARSPDPAPGRLVAWRGQVEDTRDGAVVVVRDLWASGDALADPVVWSEVFAACDEPAGQVRWSDLRLVDTGGAAHLVTRVAVNYQSLGAGGCATTDARVDGRGQADVGVMQVTNVARVTRQGEILDLGQSSGRS